MDSSLYAFFFIPISLVHGLFLHLNAESIWDKVDFANGYGDPNSPQRFSNSEKPWPIPGMIGPLMKTAISFDGVARGTHLNMDSETQPLEEGSGSIDVVLAQTSKESPTWNSSTWTGKTGETRWGESLGLDFSVILRNQR